MNDLVEYVYVEDDTQAQMAVDYLSKFDRIGYDTETTGLNIVGGVAKLLLMQLGTEEVTYVFDARKIDTGVLREILESKKILKILHNAVFDYKITKKECGIYITEVSMSLYLVIPAINSCKYSTILGSFRRYLTAYLFVR